jgi:hypothetical protein
MTACVAELKPLRQFIEGLRLFWVPRHQKAIRIIAPKMADISPKMASAKRFLTCTISKLVELEC